jgi:hypothetical protein
VDQLKATTLGVTPPEPQVVADADTGLTITDAVQHQLFGTIPSVTIQVHAFEAGLYVLTTVYSYKSWKITHPSAISSELASEFPGLLQR